MHLDRFRVHHFRLAQTNDSFLTSCPLNAPDDIPIFTNRHMWLIRSSEIQTSPALRSPGPLLRPRLVQMGKTSHAPRLCSVRPVPPRCPLGAHTVPARCPQRCPLHKTMVFAHVARRFKGMRVTRLKSVVPRSVMRDSTCISAVGTVVGTVRAPCGHRMGTAWAPSMLAF